MARRKEEKTIARSRNFWRNFWRTQKVAVATVTSSVSAVTSGIPQGTVLEPLLFLIYINDMSSIVLSTIRSFADDADIYRSIQN